MDDNEFDEKKINERQSDQNETTDDYEVGYGKPPKHTRFLKGASGNPTGRPKKRADFDTELIRESQSFITVNDNGKRRRISKLQGIFKQLHNKALTGDIRASRVILDRYQQAQDRTAVSAAQEAIELDRLNNVDELTTKELEFLVLGGDPKEIVRRRKLENELKRGKAK